MGLSCNTCNTKLGKQYELNLFKKPKEKGTFVDPWGQPIEVNTIISQSTFSYSDNDLINNYDESNYQGEHEIAYVD